TKCSPLRTPPLSTSTWRAVLILAKSSSRLGTDRKSRQLLEERGQWQFTARSPSRRRVSTAIAAINQKTDLHLEIESLKNLGTRVHALKSWIITQERPKARRSLS